MVRALDDKLKHNNVDPKLLKDLGWTERDAATWVETFKKGLKLPDIPDDDARKDREPGSRDRDFGGVLIRGDGTGSIGGTTSDDRMTLTPDQLRRLYESNRTDIPPQYQKAFRAYVRELEIRAQKEAARRGDRKTP